MAGRPADGSLSAMFSTTHKIITLGAAVAASLTLAATASAADTGVAIKSNGTVARFSVDAPGIPLAQPKAITGLAQGEVPMALDFRASDRQLFLLGVDAAGHSGHLYTLDPTTGAAK